MIPTVLSPIPAPTALVDAPSAASMTWVDTLSAFIEMNLSVLHIILHRPKRPLEWTKALAPGVIDAVKDGLVVAPPAIAMTSSKLRSRCALPPLCISCKFEIFAHEVALLKSLQASHSTSSNLLDPAFLTKEDMSSRASFAVLRIVPPRYTPYLAQRRT